MAEKKAPAAKKPTARRKAKPEGASVEVMNAQNEKVADRLVSPEVFGAKINTHLLYEAVKQYRAGGRAGTHKTKTRAMVSGTGKKPWKQKGTGRARVGEARNPLWRHGGTTFGPMPRDYSYSMPKQARAAERQAVAGRAQVQEKLGAKVNGEYAQAAQIRAQLSMVLEGVLSQTLVPNADNSGRVMAMEIMVPTPAIRNLIRQEKVHEIYSMIQSGAKVGMQTMSQSLANLVRLGKLTKPEALARAPLPEELAALLSR